MRKIAAIMTAAAGACATAGGAAQKDDPAGWDASLATEITEDWRSPEHRAFDFWIGEWDANWRPRQEGELYHDDEGTWTHQRVFPILGGKALVELAEARGAENGEPGGRGFSIRYYDPAREKWVMAQHWPNPQFDGIAFTDQLIGFERHGRLSMYSVATRKNEDGSRDQRRYNFADIAENRFRWDGSNTDDKGKRWLTWQVVEFHRTGPQPRLPAAGTPFPGVHGENLCKDAPHRSLDALEGVWAGEVETADGAAPARFTAGRLLDGCALAGVFERSSGGREFVAWSFSPALGLWAEFRLDDRPGAAHSYRIGDAAGPGAALTEAPALAIRDEYASFMEPENFSTDAGLTRTVFREMTANRLVLAEETRAAPDDEWTASAVYTLERAGGED